MILIDYLFYSKQTTVTKLMNSYYSTISVGLPTLQAKLKVSK